MTPVVIAVAATGALSAALYLRRRRWIDAALAATAGGALAGLLALPSGVTPAVDAVTVTDDTVAADVAPAARIVVPGDGLREAQWRDLPPRAVTWQAPRGDLLWLDFPRTLALGRTFALTARRSAASGPWRLQLLAENGAVLHEARGSAAQLTVHWLPPLAERLLLRARLLDGEGKTLQEGPVPLAVVPALPLHVQGRFGAPSFDTRVLNELLRDGGALLDWQTVLGKAVTRSEGVAALPAPANSAVIDASWFEGQGSGARAAVLAQVAQGMPLIVLGGNVAAPAVWQQALALRLAQQPVTTEQEDTRHVAVADAVLALAPAPWHPVAGGDWAVLATDRDGKPWLWQRPWRQGRIVWLGVAGWHRHAITAPTALGQWWQQVLDSSTRASLRPVDWVQPDPLPVAGLRTALCAHGARPGGEVAVDGQPALAWQARGDQGGAACIAFWPRQAGWVTARSGKDATDMYVFGADDWPAWQRALRQQATQHYVARVLPGDTRTTASAPTLPAWPFAVLLTAALLGLWWRERR
ncbi:hypothetical protein [Pseudoduganella armeniaca]|uniref:Uncharacterized protein n=1 Tax=Pseudoduganella armeniaca TaxID=2072590 RepID=A0A2R4CGK2_9BURK|nr:hypothetical protein [Pseudoduganella armeniaca]AVR98791.1 hypothetical protein C9I28_26525 [Pseudoduganella armeniaca]